MFNYSYMLAGLQMKLQPFPPLDAHWKHAAWGGEARRAWPACCAGMLSSGWDSRSETSTSMSTNSLVGSHSAVCVILLHPRCSSSSLPRAFSPSTPHSSMHGISGQLLTDTKGTLFSAEGKSARFLHTQPCQSKGGDLKHCLDII